MACKTKGLAFSRLVKASAVLDTGDGCNCYASFFPVYCPVCWSVLMSYFELFFSYLGGLFCCWVFGFGGAGLKGDGFVGT